MIYGSREAVNRRLAQWKCPSAIGLTEGAIEVHQPSELAGIARLM